jgi:hypothetical protein
MNLNYITGYRKKDSGPWPRIFIVLAIIILAVLWLIMSIPNPNQTTKKNPPSGEKKNTTAIKTPGEKLPSEKKANIEAQIEIQKPTEPETKGTAPRVVQAVTSLAFPAAAAFSNPSSTFAARDQRIYYFTKIYCPSPPLSIKHIWYTPAGQIASVISLNIGWQTTTTYSYHTINKKETGKWKVETVDAQNRVLNSYSFIVENR